MSIFSRSFPRLLGAAKFESYTGSRWTYTARGMVTNVAARIGAAASDGAIFLSRSTADRAREHFSLAPVGKFGLKNVSEEIEIFQGQGPLGFSTLQPKRPVL